MSTALKRQYHFFMVTEAAEWVTHVEINRPDRLNCFIEPMWQELRTVFDELSHDPSVRAVVLSGAGDRAFSAGLDVQAASKEGSLFNPRHKDMQDAARHAAQIRRFAADFQDCISSIERCEKPVICVLHGIAIGMAMDIATCADVRICVKDVRFSVKEIDIGIASDIGVLTRLPKVVGSYAWVKEVCLTGRDFGAHEALEVGFVTGISATKTEAVQKALKTASLIATKSPVASQGIKDILDWSRDHHIAAGLKYSAVWNGAAVNTTDVQKAMTSLQQKKTPRFEKL